MTRIYIDELPKTIVEITKIFGLIVRPDKYWFDYKNNAIICRCNLNFSPKPFSVITQSKK